MNMAFILYSFPSIVESFIPVNNKNAKKKQVWIPAIRRLDMLEKIFNSLPGYFDENLKSYDSLKRNSRESPGKGA